MINIVHTAPTISIQATKNFYVNVFKFHCLNNKTSQTITVPWMENASNGEIWILFHAFAIYWDERLPYFTFGCTENISLFTRTPPLSSLGLIYLSLRISAVMMGLWCDASSLPAITCTKCGQPCRIIHCSRHITEFHHQPPAWRLMHSLRVCIQFIYVINQRSRAKAILCRYQRARQIFHLH